jgi:4-hydroxy-tetrahydrodipicolinate reductase
VSTVERPLRVMVVGAMGRMGSITAEAVAVAPDMELAALVDPACPVDGAGPPRFAAVERALAAVAVDAAVDFTVPSQAFVTIGAVLAAGVDAVVGTTGLGEDEIAQLDAVRREHDAHLFMAPNFALGAVLLMRFAQEAVRYYRSAEIVELHHDGKADAPSGTALRTAQLMRDAPGSLIRGAAPGAGVQPASRGLDAAGVPIHSVRLPGLVAHQEVLFGGPGEVLTIRHDALSRESFMAGVLLALRRVGSLPGTVVGLEHLLT